MSALNNGEKWILSSGRLSSFKLSDTECKCGCGYNPMHQALVDTLQLIQDCLGKDIKINDACRCEKHNAEVGGVKNSFHVQGIAADITVKDDETGDDMDSEKLYDELKFMDIPCIIRYPGHHFCHVDTREGLTRLSKDKVTGAYIPI